jgi:hypothetical protein
MILSALRGAPIGMRRALQVCMHNLLTTGLAATALLLGLTGCSFVDIDRSPTTTSVGAGGSGGSSSSSETAATSATTGSGGKGGSGGQQASCTEVKDQTAASWAMMLGDCREFVDGNATCPPTEVRNDVCGLSYVAVHGDREVPPLIDGQACGAAELGSTQTLIRAVDAEGRCQAYVTIDANLPLGQRDLQIVASPSAGLFLRGTFKNRLLVNGSVIDEAEEGGPSRRGFVATMDVQGRVEVVMHIEGVSDSAELAFGELASNDKSLFMLLTAKGTIKAEAGHIRIVPLSAQLDGYHVAVVERRLDGTSTVVHSIAQQQSVPFTALSLAVHQGVLAATFTACATSDGDCSELLFDTEAEQLGDSTGYKGMRVWSMNLDTEFADPWMRRMNTGMSADSLALSAEGPLRLVYRSYSNGPLSIYADLENPTSSSQARLDVQPDNSDLKLGSLASFSEGEALVVGTFRGDSLSYKPTWGSTEVLSPDDPGVPSETRRRGFMVRLGTAEEIPPYHEIASSRDVVLLGASEQERNGSGIRYLVGGSYNGTLDLGEGVTLPTSAAVSDFVASLVWE